MTPGNLQTLRYGYRYQNHVGVLRLIDVLAGNCNEVTFEKKGSDPDYYDDIKAESNNEIHHYQIKGSFDSESTITIKNFVAERQIPDFYLVNYFLSWINLRDDFPKQKNFVHMYTSRKIAVNDLLQNVVKKINDEKTKLSDNPKSVFQFDKKIINNVKFKEVFQIIRNLGHTDDDIEQFLDSLIIETSQPWVAIDPVTKNPIKEIFFAKLKQLGLDEYPNKKNIGDVYRHLLEITDRESINKRTITRDLLLQELQIITNYGSIPQDIDFDEDRYIPTNDLKTIDSLIANSSAKTILVTGKPGVGKTWLLTKWRQIFQEQNSDFPPIWYYVFLRVTGDEYYEERIRYQQIISNFIDAISRHYPSLISEQTRFSATKNELENLLKKLGAKAESEGRVVPIIIDGLDHVIRIKEQNGLSKDEKDILEFLKNFSIPKGICLIIGSQPGKHLKFIMKEFVISNICEISGFTEPQTNKFLSRFSFAEDLTSDQIYQIHQKTNGIPILLTYLTNSLQQRIEPNTINNFPETNGDVKNYYDYLWNIVETKSRHLARYFSLLEFAVNRKFLNSLYTFEDRDGRSLESVLEDILPVLYSDQNKKFSIFHDSFRTYIFNKTNFSHRLKEKYCERIYKTLIRKQQSMPRETFQYSIKYAYDAKDYDFIINQINIEYSDYAIKHLYRKQDLTRNLNYAILAASQKGDLVKTIFFGILRFYSLERFQYLSNSKFRIILTKLFPEEMTDFLLNQRTLNFSLEETLDILATAIKNGIHLPYQEIMNIWKNKNSIYEGNKLPDGTDFESYALVIGYLGGIERVLEFLTINKFTMAQALLTLRGVIQITNLQKLEKIHSTNPKYKYYLRILRILLLIDKNSRTKLHMELEDLVTNGYLLTIPNNLEILIKSNFSSQEIKPFLIFPIFPVLKYSNRNIQFELERFSDQIIALSFCNEQASLISVYNKIFQRRGSLFFNILDLVYSYSKLSGEIYAKKQYNFEELLISFETFFTSREHSDAYEYFTDGHIVELFLENLIKKIINLTMKFGTRKNKTSLLKIISIFNKKYYLTYTSIEEGYIEVLNDPQPKWIKNSISKYVDPNPFYEDTQGTVNSLLEKAILYTKLDEKYKARKAVDRMFNFTFSYGYHKDTFLFEMLDLVASLSKFEPGKKLSRLRDLLTFAELLSDITDNDETRHLINYIISEIMKTNASAAFQVAKGYGVDSWRFSNAVEYLIQNRHDVPPEIRFYLGESLPYNSDAFDNRIQPINDCMKSRNIRMARTLLLKLRTDLETDFFEKKYEYIKSFNRLAAKLKIPTLRYESIKPQQKTHYKKEQMPITLDKILSRINERYGWSIGSPYENYVQKLVRFYVKDKRITAHKISASYAIYLMEHEWANHGGLERSGKLLAEANDRTNLRKLFELTFNLCTKFFREYKKTTKFDWLMNYKENDNAAITSIHFLFEQLMSYDYEIQKRAFNSLFNLLILKNSIALDMVLEYVQNTSTNMYLREHLCAVLDTYVHKSADGRVKIINCSKNLLITNNRTMVLSAKSILSKLGSV